MAYLAEQSARGSLTSYNHTYRRLLAKSHNLPELAKFLSELRVR